mgnify:CR=1 FL=1
MESTLSAFAIRYRWMLLLLTLLASVLAAAGLQYFQFDGSPKAFVDDEAGSDVAEKVTRRLQHFIDRKIATLFEPLFNLSRDETLTGLARGFAFQMVEAFGILPRADVANDVKSLDQDGRVIYVGSFSKSLFPGLRLGYLVGPAAFIREARALRASVFRHPPGHIQRTVSYFLSLGHYDALVRRMGKTYHERRQVVDDAIQGTGLTMAGKGAYGGSSVWVRAPDGVDTSVLAANLLQDGVLIEPGASFFAGDAPPSQYVRLAYSSIVASKIPEGVARIDKRIRALV